MTFADCPDTHDEAQIAVAYTGLVRVDHDAGIAQSGAFNGVFTREGRAKQQASGRRQVAFGVEAIRELVCMPEKRFGQATVSALEPFHDIVKTPFNLVVRQRQEALQDRGGSRVLLVKPLVPRHEQASHHP
jgi:hypothetical protein